jgi:hypothetical protein
MRYKVYGMYPSDHSEDNSDTSVSNQLITNAVNVYETNDRNEAKRLVSEGGFITEDRGYVVVQGAKDTISGGIIGIIPKGV